LPRLVAAPPTAAAGVTINSVGTIVACPSAVPELTISRPAIIHTGPAASYQVWPARWPELKLSISPLRTPMMSPLMA